MKTRQSLIRLSIIGLGLFLLLFFSWVWRKNRDNTNTQREMIKETIVLSEQSDPYFDLAQKIAQSENLEIIQNLTDALKYNPKFIILVASPENLSEERLLNIGNTYKSHNYYPALGIISGSSIEKAEQLWMRRETAQGGKNYLGSDIEKGQVITKPMIFNISEGADEEFELNKTNLINTLKEANYFYWARHVTENTWFWNRESKNFGEDDKLYAKDLPELDSVVIYTPSCGSFQPWKDDSIALGFVDKGSAAYLGHVHSPISNAFLMRQGLLVPGEYTWEEFPLGITAQIQNKMTARAAHATPLYFMLGDPRIYLSKNKPYQINTDNKKDGKRILQGESNKHGVLAIKIEDGAKYKHVNIKGVATAGENDFFYNNNLQSLNLAGDKYILFFHQGGGFEIELTPKSPFAWNLIDILIDALDYSWITIGVVYTPISLIFLAAFGSIVLFKTLHQKKLLKDYGWVFLIGILFALLRLVYLMVRINDYSVNASMVSYPISKIIFGVIGMFATTSGGLMLMKDAQKALVKVSGLLFAVFPQLLLTGFYFVTITATNLIFRLGNPTPTRLWNYSAFWLPFTVLLLECFFILSAHTTNTKKNSIKEI